MKHIALAFLVAAAPALADSRITSSPTSIGAGGDFDILADLPQISACVSSRPYITVLYQDGALDFTPVQP